MRDRQLINRVRAHRLLREWSQAELATHAGLSRAEISAIETGRLVPSTTNALALADALGCRVEDLFAFDTQSTVEWAWTSPHETCRFWRAEVDGRELLYPVEAPYSAVVRHDGVFRDGVVHDAQQSKPPETLVLACCDPAAGLLIEEFQRATGFRMIVLHRSSREGLRLLQQGLVHAAGVHLARVGQSGGNTQLVQNEVSRPVSMLRIANWQEGVAVAPKLGMPSIDAVAKAKIRWVGREPGSAARKWLDELTDNPRPPRRIARDHRGVADAIRCGWADAGVCHRLASEEAGLNFLSLDSEEYDLCFSTDSQGDPRLIRLCQLVSSVSYRQLLAELPGFDSTQTGEMQTVASSRAESNPE